MSSLNKDILLTENEMIDKFTEQLKEINIQTNEIINQNRILIKALELACEDVNGLHYWNKDFDRKLTEKVDYYIQQAKESLDEN